MMMIDWGDEDKINSLRQKLVQVTWMKNQNGLQVQQLFI